MRNIVITGDSLSYNRYGYDDIARMDAWDCHIGMDSWSFRLRKKIISETKGFKYADEIAFKENAVSGLGGNTNIADAIFGERVRTITPENGKILFKAESDNGKIVIFFQKRPQNYCRFSISVDGIAHPERVDTFGDTALYHGYDVFAVDKKIHDIVFYDFENTEFSPMVTVAGVSEEFVNVAVTGQGSRTASFINYHFKARIEKYTPDTMILIFGGNDCIYFSPEDYRENLKKLLGKVKEKFPDCRLITITIPPSGLYSGIANGKKYETQAEWDKNISRYNSVLKEVSALYNAETIETEKLFEGIPHEKWRFDEVHFTNFGNDILFEEVCKVLQI